VQQQTCGAGRFAYLHLLSSASCKPASASSSHYMPCPSAALWPSAQLGLGPQSRTHALHPIVQLQATAVKTRQVATMVTSPWEIRLCQLLCDAKQSQLWS
jgi:hypothetical protein